MDDVVIVCVRSVVELLRRLKEVLVRLLGRMTDRKVLTKEGTGRLYQAEHKGRQVLLWIPDGD